MRHPVVVSTCWCATGLSAHVLPELDELRACQDPQHRHKDVWAHTLAVLEQAIDLEDRLPDGGPDVVLRFAALLHDVGKPDTREIHGDRTVTFHHHDVVGARMTRHRLRELRFDKDTVKDVSELVRLHLRFHTFESGWTDAAVRRYVRDAGHLLERLNALTRADVTTGNARKAARIQRNVDLLEERIERAPRAGGARRAAAADRRQPDHGAPRHPARARWSARRGSTCSSSASTRGRWTRPPRSPRSTRWWAAREDAATDGDGVGGE